MSLPAEPPPALVVLFDGGCPICRRTVRTLRRLDWRDALRFADATSAAHRQSVAPSLTDADVMQQMYVAEPGGRLFGGYDAQVRIAREVPLLWPLFAVGWLPGVKQIGTAIYRRIAARRRREGVCSDDLCSPGFRRS